MHADPPAIAPYDADAELCAAARASGGPLVRVQRPRTSMVVLGASSRPATELRLDACRAAGAPLLRRPGGGCAVVLDPGNVLVAVAYRVAGFGGAGAHFACISAWLIDALLGAGVVGVRVAGASDLTLGDRKFAGAAIQRTRDLLYYSAALLADPDIDLIERVLRHPPREPAYRRGRTHAEFLQPLVALRREWTAPWLEAELIHRLDPDRLHPPSR